MTKRSVAETSTPRDHSDPPKDIPRTPRDPQGAPWDTPQGSPSHGNAMKIIDF